MFILCFKLLEISDVEVEMALKGGLPGLYMKMTFGTMDSVLLSTGGMFKLLFSFFAVDFFLNCLSGAWV